MMLPYQNPYSAVDPDVGEYVFERDSSLISKLDSRLLYYRDEPSCVSVVAERCMGGPAIVRWFLRTRADKLHFRVVECDVKTDLGSGDRTADFYRSLVSFVLHSPDLPDKARRAGDRLVKSTSDRLQDLNDDLLDFFCLVP